MMMRAMYEAACADRLYPVGESKDGFMTLRMELDEEKREKIYEDVFERRLRDGAESRLTDVQKKLLEPMFSEKCD